MIAPTLSCTTSFIFFAAVVFSVVSLAHIARVITGWPVQIGPWSVPHWASVAAAVVAAIGAIWGFTVLFMH